MNRLSIVEKLINELNEREINYCHWKSNQHVHDAFNGIDDIDLLISTEEIHKLNVILNKIGYKRFVLPSKRKYPGIEDYIGYDELKGIFVHLHLHYNLTIGEKFLKGFQLPYGDKILENRIFDEKNSIFTSSIEDEMWLLIVRTALKLRIRDKIKMIMKNQLINDGTNEEFVWLQKRINYNKLQDSIPNSFSDESKKIILTIIKSNLSYSKLHKLQKHLKNNFKYFRTDNTLKSKYLKWNREFFRVKQILNKKIIKDPVSYRRSPISGGKVVSLLGPDGAGKSTLLYDLEKTLAKQFDTEKIYLGSGDGNSSLIRLPLKFIYKILLKQKIIDRKSKEVKKDGSFNYANETKKSSILRKLGEAPWVLVLTFEKINKIKKAWKFKNKGYIVLTDRYPQSQVIGMLDGPRFYKNNNSDDTWLINKVKKYEKNLYDLSNILNPNLVIVLKVSPEVALSRKPDEISIDSHKNLMNKLMELDFVNSKIVYIDANQNIENVRKQVMKEVWGIL